MESLNPSLVDRLLRSAPGASFSGDRVALESTLVALCDAASAAAHGVKLSSLEFVPYLGARLPQGADVTTSLARVCGPDLWLACACLRGDAAATRLFDERLSSMVHRVGARMRQPTWALDEVKQTLRERLLVSRDGAAPKLADYAGHGLLDAWLRVIVVRTVISSLRGQKSRHGTLDDARLFAELPCADPELALLRQRHAGDVEAAFRDALSALKPREGAVLRLYVIERMLPAHIAVTYGVDRTTVVRWLQAIYEKLLDQTRQALRARLNLSDTGMSSLLRAMHSHLNDRVGSLLRAGAGDPQK